VVNVKTPDFETRLRILQDKAKKTAEEVTTEVLEVIAQHEFQNVRQLEGGFNRVIAYARLLKTSPTSGLATQALEDVASKRLSPASSTPSLIIEAVADSFQLSPDDLKSKKRKQSAVAREVAVYLLRQGNNYSLEQIGAELGGRDPSFVSRACRKIANDIDGNSYLRRKVADIQQRLSSK
jgi:chromosomal replication initiator protein